MLKIYDRAAMARALTLDLDPRLHALLESRFPSLVTADGDLTDWTEFLIVEYGDAESDVVRELGFSPLVEPLDGARFGSAGFQPFWDDLIDHDGWFELTLSFGSTFAYILYIEDAAGVMPELRSMCRQYAR